MKRRDFLALTGGATAAWPMAALAQKVATRVGFLASGSAGSAFSAGQLENLKQGLYENGLIEGRDYVLDVEFAAGNYDRFPEMARRLALAGARLLLVNTTRSVRAAQEINPPRPIVMLNQNDPVGNGLVAGLARPGGHTTGIASLNEDLTPKTIEFQLQIVPDAKVIAVLFNPANPSVQPLLGKVSASAQAKGMTVKPFALSSRRELAAVFSALAAEQPDTIQLLPDTGNMDLADRVADIATAQRIPTFSNYSPFAFLGGLLSYGMSERWSFSRAAYLVKRILDGADPGELPVEQPTKIELVVNMKTARSLGVSLAPSLLARADEVIE